MKFSNQVKDIIKKRSAIRRLKNELKKGNIRIIEAVDLPIITREIVDKCSNQIIKLIEHQNGFYTVNNQYILEKILELGKFNLIYNFKGENFTKEIVDKYGNQIIEELKAGFVYSLAANPYLLEKALELGEYEIALKFRGESFTKEIVDKYGNQIIEELKANMPYSLGTNPYLLEKTLELGEYGVALKFRGESFTKEIVDKYGNQIIEELKAYKYNPLGTNPYLFEKALELGEYEVVFKFGRESFTKEIVDKYGNQIIEELKADFVYSLANNPYLLEKALELGEYELAFRFKGENFTKEIVGKYGNQIIEELKANFVHSLAANPYLLEKALELGEYEVALKFRGESFTKEIVDKYGNQIIEELKVDFVYSLGTNPYLLGKALELGEYELALKFRRESFTKEIVDKYGDQVAGILNISYNLLKYKVSYLNNRNDELFKTLDIRLLGEKFKHFSMEDIEKFALYQDIQEQLINMDEKELFLFSTVINILDKNHYDCMPIIYNCLQNLSNPKYYPLIQNYDISKIGIDELLNLVTILQKNNNVYEISNFNELSKENFENKKNEYYKKINKKIDDGSIDREELSEAILEKKFGLTLKQANFIVDRYCYNVAESEKTGLNKNIVSILTRLNRIVNSESLDNLKFEWLVTKDVKYDIYSSISLESAIRKEYTRMYGETLYRPKEVHRTQNAHLENVTGIKFYELDGDFNMDIHVLGAYGTYNYKYSTPSNFEEDWNKPKITYHGICTSYISNDQIAVARQQHPILGFSNFEPSCLLLSGNYDLLSDGYNVSYSTSLGKPYSFLPPRQMINSTRHNHNEIVIERLNATLDLNGNYKRQPDYIVLIVDDITDEANFQGELYQETIKAASDFNVPIVIIDRLKYAKQEKEKCLKMEKEFLKNKKMDDRTPEKLRELFLKYMNNSVGCRFFGGAKAKYQEEFSSKVIDEFVNRIPILIKSEPDLSKRQELIKTVKYLIEQERKNYATIYAGAPACLNNLSNELEQMDKKATFKEPINDFKIEFMEYYQNADEIIKEQIKNDIENKVTIEEILTKLKNGSYSGGEFDGKNL